MKVRLNKAHFPVTALGPGRRIGLWLQGCSAQCPGCISRDTWADDPSREITISGIIDWCRGVSAKGCDGVTISGGEPFEQARALSELIKEIRAWSDEIEAKMDILCYSGLPLRRLQLDHAAILEQLDALIPEPFVASLSGGSIWRGSANQPIVPLSDLGLARYGSSALSAEDERRLQFAIDGSTLWCIGIPERGNLEAVEIAARARGVTLGGVSWRA